MGRNVPLRKVPGGELAAHLIANGVEALQSTVDYNNKLQQMDWSNTGSWFSTTAQNLTSGLTQQMMYDTQQIIMDESSVTGSDWIFPIDDYSTMREQQFTTMGYYILANPTVTKKVKRGILAGYNNDYVNTEDDYLPQYYEVIDGIQVNGLKHGFEGTKKTFTTSSTYFVGMRELTFEEKVDILNTWDAVNKVIDEGLDPTEPIFDDDEE